MLLKNLINNLSPKLANTKINGISFDSRLTKKGDLFVCIKGNKLDGKNFIEKATLKGAKVKPQEITFWKLPKKHIFKLTQSYNNLMMIYDEAKILDPYNLAVAISSLDCWAEQQEENWQTWDIKKCKDDFLNAMHEIYAKISNNATNQDKQNLEDKIINNPKYVTKVTKTKIKKSCKLYILTLMSTA